MAPFAKLYPKPVSGTVAPEPAKSTKYLYRPSPPNITPAVTNVTSILAEVNFDLYIPNGQDPETSLCSY